MTLLFSLVRMSRSSGDRSLDSMARSRCKMTCRAMCS
jgi:hypothetical protein